MRAAQSSRLRTLVAAAVPVGLVLSAALVWQSTSAAFTATTENPGNSWQTGTVVLDASAGGTTGSALFDSGEDGLLAPGMTGSRCIRVDYTGSLPADIRFYVTTPLSGATALDGHLVLSVEEGQDVEAGTPVTPDCRTGFESKATPTFLFNTAPAGEPESDLDATLGVLRDHSGHSSGIPVGRAAGSPVATPVQPGTHLTFKISYAVVGDDAPQGSSSDVEFVWEARSA